MSTRSHRFSFSEQLKLAFVLLTVSVIFVQTDWLWRWDQQLYDIQMQSWSQPAPDDVVIVAIDETSLVQLGRWPWSRQIHAQLINRLIEADAKTVILDIIFAEENPADPSGDRALAQAIKNAGNVVLPVLVEQPRLGAPLKETLPIPMLIEAGAKLGHVHIELDADGIARSVYLYEGLGKPHWPNLSLAALQLQTNQEQFKLPVRELGNPGAWHRAEHRLIPFIGPPGHFSRISYKDILLGRFSPESIRGKTVLIGVTATGLGDALPSPVSGLTHPMPGVEINANIFTAIRDGRNITAIDHDLRLYLSIFIVFLPVLLFPRVKPGAALFLTGGLILSTALLSLYLLLVKLIWFPPLAVIISLILSYPIWSWRRLDFTVKYLDEQLALLHKEPGLIPEKQEINLKKVTAFLASVLPCNGWAVFTKTGHSEFQKNCTANSIPSDLPFGKWHEKSHCFWLKTRINEQLKIIVLQFDNKGLSQVQKNLLEEISDNLYPQINDERMGTVEIIENQIMQVQTASSRLRSLRQFVSASLEQMADGVVILSSLGRVVLFNQKVTELFVDLDLKDSTILDILAECKIEESVDWQKMFIQVLSERKALQIQAIHQNGKDLLIQFAALIGVDNSIIGVIVNFSDISHIKEIERKRIEFINFLSHDLRSPLSSALAIIQIGNQQQGGIDQNNISRLKQYTERALQLTEEFVHLARAENIDSLNFRESDLVDIVFNASDQLWEMGSSKGIKINVNTSLHNALIMADPALLERAVINLISNAIKYSPNNTCINVAIREEAENYLCEIKDEGPGIPDEEIPKLFDRFHRVPQMGQDAPPGIGLGLTFVKVVIDGHHGVLKVESVLNQGSTFSFALEKL